MSTIVPASILWVGEGNTAPFILFWKKKLLNMLMIFFFRKVFKYTFRKILPFASSVYRMFSEKSFESCPK